MNEIIEKTFSELEKTQKDFWNISRQTANFLNMLIKISGCKNALEIGTSNGYSGIWLALALKENNGKLTTIEFWENRQSIAIENFKNCGVYDSIRPLLGSAAQVLEQETFGEIDFAFIDASKREYLRYFELIHPMLKSGGIITADNVLSHEEKVRPFVEAISNHSDYQVEILNLPAGLLVARKK